MERSSLAKWLVGVALAVVLGFIAGRQQQLVDTQTEILRQLQDLRASRPSQATEAGAQGSFDLRIEGAAIKGDASAKVTLVEFSDFECPYCGSYFRESYSRVNQDYVAAGKIRYVFRHFPLAPLHPHAMKAGEAGECARRQGKFWPMHDQLFANQKSLEQAALTEYAKTVGLEMKAFTTCLEGEASATVLTDLDAGTQLGVDATPTFFFGFAQNDGSVKVVEKVVGAKPYVALQTVIDRLLATPEAMSGSAKP